MREALFSILGDRASADAVLDLYAGTGALGLEALSRGARSVVFVERSKEALQALNANVDALGVRAQVRVIALPIERALRGLQTGQEARFDLVLADPPYSEVENGAATRALETLVVPHMTRGALLVLEHASRDAAPAIANLEHEDARKYGDTTLSFYTCARDA